MDTAKTKEFIDKHWDSWYVPGLSDFVKVPNLTPMVDPEYLENKLVYQAYELVDSYINKLEIKGISKKEFKSETGLPLFLYIVEPSGGSDKNIMVYGHLDKQPYGAGWETNPTEPVIKDYTCPDGKVDQALYGRGGGDDGYAPFTCMLGIKAAQEQGVKMPRICLVLETEEESGSEFLVTLLKMASEAIGPINACFCMDSGAFDYNNLWITSSLRGICILDVTVEAGTSAYHSGEVGGIVPETFRVMRALLDRLDDPLTGKCLKELDCPIPQWKVEEAEYMAKLSGTGMYTKYAVHDGVKMMEQDDLVKLYLNNQWNANLSVTGADGLPPVGMAGNAVRASTSVRCSMRLPPSMDPVKAEEAMRKALTTDVPYNCKVTVKGGHAGAGWCMKDLSPELMGAIKKAGADFYDGLEAKSYGMGGSIPFLSELGSMYPTTEIVAFGVLGPNSNAHGPNELINLTYTKKLTCALAHIMQSMA